MGNIHVPVVKLWISQVKSSSQSDILNLTFTLEQPVIDNCIVRSRLNLIITVYHNVCKRRVTDSYGFLALGMMMVMKVVIL